MSLLRWCALTICALALAACHKRGPDTDRPAEASADPPLQLPERPFDFHHTTLANGMQVVTLEDHSTPIAAVQVWYHVGSKDEKPNRRGFAHMFEHMMFRGTQNIGPKAHFEYIRRVGGWANAFTSFDNTTYVQVVPSNQVEMVLWLEAERMGFLKINDGYFDTERNVVAEEYRMGREAPYGTAPEKLLGELFTKHPYRWSPIGDMNELAQADAKELQQFWETYYVPNNAVLVVVGDVEHDEVEAMAQRAFGWIPKYDDPPRVTVKEPVPTEPRKIAIKERNGPVPIVGVLWRTVPLGHEDELALEMLGHILGGGESSRLWRDLVREKDLAMFALSAAFTLEDDGIIAAGAVLDPFGSKPDQALSAIRTQIERIRKEGVTDEEVAKARNNMLRAEVTSLLTVQSKAQKLGEAALIEGDLEAVNREFRDIAGLTAADVKRVAGEYCKPEREVEVRIEPNLLGFIVDQFTGKGGDKKKDEGKHEGEEKISGAGEGKPGLVRPEHVAELPEVAPPLTANPKIDSARKTLDNGLPVVVIENDEVPFVTMWLGLDYGAFADPSGKPGTAFVTLPMLARGTKTHDYKALTEELDRHAISLSGSARMDFASVSASAVSNQTDRALRLLAEAVMEPTFPADELEEYVDQTVTGLMVTERAPQYLADRELRRRLFAGHPYERLPEGRAAGLRKLTRDDLEAWWRRHARPDAAVLYIAGHVQQDEAFALAQKYFGGWKVEGERPKVAVPAPPAPAKTKIYLVDRAGNQSQIRVGHVSITRSDPRYPTARVATEYFGGGFNSRLNDTIRVKKGLTYGAGGGFAPDRFAGRFTVSTFSKNATVAETVRTILEEIERFEKEGPTEREAGDSKSYILGSFAGARETPQDLVEDLWRIEVEGLPADYYDRYLDAIGKVVPGQTVGVVDELVQRDHLVIVVVGPADTLKKQLANIADVEVVPAYD
jgi:zinc protease